MSLESIVEAANLASNAEANDETPDFEEKVISLAETKKTKTKGRPNIHPIEGRTYLLQSEVSEAFANPESFADRLQQMHSISDTRTELFKSNNIEIGPAAATDFTLYGPVLSVMNIASSLIALYPDGIPKLRISKSKIVSPSNSLYEQPVTDTIAIKGKEQIRVKYQEFSPYNIYVYITIAKKV